MARSLRHPFQSGPAPKAGAGAAPEALLEVDGHGLPLLSRGEVHDTFDLGDHLLIVATDRVGVNGVILKEGIPERGLVDTGLSRHWFAAVESICANHLAGQVDWPGALKHDRHRLEPRSLLVRKAKAIPFECTVRGYMTRKGLEEYLSHGTVGGRPVTGVLRSGRLPRPRLVPTRRDVGARTPVTVADMANEVGAELADRLEQTSIAVYEKAAQQARTRDVVIAQTTLRFGWIDDELRLIGECITPDSSSYWIAETLQPGARPTSLGKGYLLESLTALGWDGSAPGPHIPPDVVARIRERYVDAYARITGDRHPG